MLPIETCRALLGVAATHLADSDIAALRDQLCQVAGVAIALYASGAKVGKLRGRDLRAKLSDFSAAERVQIEERAAVLEFDAKIPRDLATRRAIRERLQQAADERE